MVGIVALVRGDRDDRVVVETDLGFSYFEILGASEMQQGDEVRGAFNSLGGETLRVESSGQSVEDFIEDIYSSRENTAEFVFEPS